MSIEDNLYHLLGFYKRLPDWAKYFLAYPFRILPREYYLGKNYKKIINDAIKLDYASKEKIEEYQFLKLSQLLQEAYQWIPYYKTEWDKLGVDLKQIQSFSDFKKNIPVINKEDIQKNLSRFISTKYPVNKHMIENTAGSTGKPLSLYYLKGYSRIADRAYTDFMWNRIGYKVGNKIARLRGDYFGPEKISSFDPYRNTLMLSSFTLNSQNIYKYIEQLRKYKIEFISAYPSSLINLIQLGENIDGYCPDLKGIMLGSENIYEWQIDLVKGFFQINNIFLDYGQGELSVWAGTCNHSSKYHFHPGFSYTEFIDENNRDENLNIENKIVKIIGTGFYNPLMPFIRYNTNDLGILSNSKCGCGRNHQILDTILGRKQEMAIGFNGEKITLTALLCGRHSDFLHHLYKIQFINTSPGELDIKIITKETFNINHKAEIINNFSNSGGMPFNCNINEVDKLIQTENGKEKVLIKTF